MAESSAAPQIIRADETAEYWFDEGCYILELSNSEQDPAVSIARARVLPGHTTQWHALSGTVERYLILEGSGRVDVGERSESVAAGAVVLIPPACRQRISNTGEVDLLFLAICSPRFQRECYRAL